MAIPENLELAEVKTRVRDEPVCIVITKAKGLANPQVFPDLGSLRLAAVLDDNKNYVEVLDLSGSNNPERELADYAKTTNIRHFGIGCTTPQFPETLKARDIIRENHPNPAFILGGPHATYTYAAMLRDRQQKLQGRGTYEFNQFSQTIGTGDTVVVAGDGEKAVFYALDSLASTQAADPDCSIKVIDACSRTSPLLLRNGELEGFPFPARDRIRLTDYKYNMDGGLATSITVQLGCPFSCGFCSGKSLDFLRMVRSRSTDNALAELESIYNQYGFSRFMLYDDELNISDRALDSFCRGAIQLQDRLQTDFRFRGFVRADLFSEKQAELMFKAGFREILVGIESGSREMLDSMGKRTTPEQNTECRAIAKKAGLRVKALMSFPHPGETFETVQESIDWVIQNEPEGTDISMISVLPGSRYSVESIWDSQKGSWRYTTTLRFGLRKGQEVSLWSDAVDYSTDGSYYKTVPGEYGKYISVETEVLKKADNVRLRDYAEELIRSKLGQQPVTRADKAIGGSMGMGLPFPVNI